MLNFDNFLSSREEEEEKKGMGEERVTADVQRKLIGEAPQEWKRLHEVVREVGSGKKYKDALFTWRSEAVYPISLILKNLAASFMPLDGEHTSFAVQVGEFPATGSSGCKVRPRRSFSTFVMLGQIDGSMREKMAIRKPAM